MGGIGTSLIRWIYRRAIPGPLRNSLRLALLLAERDRSPELIVQPTGKTVMVLAPHMDDEVLGCGGTLAKHIQAGAHVTVVYMTDGGRGDVALNEAELRPDQRREAQAALVALRKAEAARAAKLLGIQGIIYLDYPDGALRVDAGSVAKMDELLRALRPDHVYLPFVMDLHEDHWQTNCIFYEAARRLPAAQTVQLTCLGYEIWTPLFANRVVDISDVIELKLRAVAEFQSQLLQVDYKRCVEGLNTYRAMVQMRGIGYAEAFFVCPLSAYCDLFRQLTDRHKRGR